MFLATDWDDFMAAGVDEITQTAMLPMVGRRLRIMLEMILAMAPNERRPGIERRIETLAAPTHRKDDVMPSAVHEFHCQSKISVSGGPGLRFPCAGVVADK